MNPTGIVILLGVVATQLFFIQQVLIRIAEVLERLADGKRAIKVDVLR